MMQALQATAGQLETVPHRPSMVPAAAAPTQHGFIKTYYKLEH